MKFSALAFPPYPGPFSFVPEPLTMQKKESIPGWSGPVLLVQLCNSLGGPVEEFFIARRFFGGGVRPI
jgi:hypothetical protein